jgi:cellulose synthase (UDP-forming)
MSVSRQLGLRTLGLASAGFSLGYLVWRAGWTINWAAPWLSLPLFVAELHGFFTFALLFFMVWDVTPLRRSNASRTRTVDVFIPTFNGPYEVLAPAVAAASDLQYPLAEVYVLDDGERPWVREMCERFEVRYLTRTEHSGAKAGNINAALPHTSGEFIAFIDADFIMRPDYVEQLIGYLEDDDRVAIVQGPQEFYNVDSFQHAAGDTEAWHEQRIFFEVIQVGKNRWNSAFWAGSPSIVRRVAIEELGGIPTESVTEDLHTSLLLHQRGWRTAYHPGVVALGIAPDDYDGFILQRQRWAQGAMQVIRREWLGRGISFAQWLNYVASTGTYFDSFRKAILLLAVPMVLLTDQLPIVAPVGTFFVLWTLHFSLGMIANIALGRGHYRYLYTELFDLLKMFAFIQASIVLFSARALRFKVTPKGVSGNRSLHPFLVPFVGTVAVYLGALAVGAARLNGWGLTTANPAALSGAAVWGLGILAVLIFVIARGIRHITKRAATRLALDMPARITSD